MNSSIVLKDWSRASAKSGEPYKVGTFEIRKTTTVGLVVRDSVIVDIAAANAAVPGRVAAPRDMIDLIERYDSGVRARLVEIVNYLGEVIEASIDGIGTLRMPVVAGPQPPGGTGARLPPVSSYRKQ